MLYPIELWVPVQYFQCFYSYLLLSSRYSWQLTPVLKRRAFHFCREAMPWLILASRLLSANRTPIFLFFPFTG
jgi:hypothetical protein